MDEGFVLIWPGFREHTCLVSTHWRRRVLVVDLDPQQNLRAWGQGRESDAPMMLANDPAPHSLRDTLDAAQEQFDFVVDRHAPRRALKAYRAAQSR